MPDTVDIDRKPTTEDVWAARVEPGDPPTLRPVGVMGWRVLRRFVGQNVVVRVERPKAVRSNAANAYLWGVVYPDVLEGLRELAQAHGERCPFVTTDDLHEACKFMFLGTRVVELPGAGQVEVPSTTTTLTTAQFSVYVDKIIRWAGERAIPVRMAGE